MLFKGACYYKWYTRWSYHHDGQWQGFTRPIDLVVDLRDIQDVDCVAMIFMQMICPGVYMPGGLEVLLSEEGKKLSQWAVY